MRRIAIMQPYLFPYIGYFSLIKHTQQFILLDTVQYIRHGWIERNRILKPNEGWQYIKVPLKKQSRETLIKDVKINNSTKWSDKIIAQLQHYKKKAPFYIQTIKLLNSIFENEYQDIVSLNHTALKAICDYLSINNPIEIFSEMDLSIDQVNEPDEWALNICKALGDIDEYWNPPGGQSFFDTRKYDNAGINLRFHSIIPFEYQQKGSKFETGLSIIDVMMFNSPEEINEMLDNYELD